MCLTFNLIQFNHWKKLLIPVHTVNKCYQHSRWQNEQSKWSERFDEVGSRAISSCGLCCNLNNSVDVISSFVHWFRWFSGVIRCQCDHKTTIAISKANLKKFDFPQIYLFFNCSHLLDYQGHNCTLKQSKNIIKKFAALWLLKNKRVGDYECVHSWPGRKSIKWKPSTTENKFPIIIMQKSKLGVCT